MAIDSPPFNINPPRRGILGRTSSVQHFADSITSSTTTSLKTVCADPGKEGIEEGEVDIGLKFLDHQPISCILLGAIIGLGSGIVVFYCGRAGTEVVMAGSPSTGLLLVRVLECIFVPLFVFSLVIGLLEILSLGESGSVIGAYLGRYAGTTVCAAVVDWATTVANFFSDLAVATTVASQAQYKSPASESSTDMAQEIDTQSTFD